MPGHRDELRLKATALQGLEGMNGRGGVSPWPPHLVPPGPPSLMVWVTSEETLPVKHSNQSFPSCLCAV